MTVYLFNTLTVPINFDEQNEARIILRRITVQEARDVIKDGFISAVGHESTAKILSQILGANVPYERRTVFMRPGDTGIHIFLKSRIPEGKVLTEEEIKNLPFWLVQSLVLP
jgi:hypothetical protein